MTWVIAHRGSSEREPENTLPAFERAIADGADFVEFDVQMSADGVPVVFHDRVLERLTPLAGPLRLQAAADLQEVGIPTLEQVLDVVRGRIGVMAELKNPRFYSAQPFVERVVSRLEPDDVVISFQQRALLETRRLAPRLRLLQHVGLGVSIRAAARYAWGVGFVNAAVTRRGLGLAQALGLVTTVYTVNDEARLRELAALGVGGVFTDRPDRLRAVLRRPG